MELLFFCKSGSGQHCDFFHAKSTTTEGSPYLIRQLLLSSLASLVSLVSSGHPETDEIECPRCLGGFVEEFFACVAN
jgi:hypothetical protein